MSTENDDVEIILVNDNAKMSSKQNVIAEQPIKIKSTRQSKLPHFMLNSDIEKAHGKIQSQDIVERLKLIPQPPQRSEQWYKMRDGMLTASDWGAVMGESYDTPESVIKKKCGYGEQFTGNDATRWGQKYEPVANMIYERRNSTKVIEFGLIPHPSYPFLGASPDGITENGVMVEIKCPPRRKITGEPPRHYWCQVQAQLEVCDLERCDFLECKFDEFASKDEYYRWSSSEFEKGIIIVFKMPLKEGETVPHRYYEYLDPCINGSHETQEECDNKSINEAKEKHPMSEFEEVTYWKLITVSCVPIFRDKTWFAEALPQLRETWNRIENYRANGGIEELDMQTEIQEDDDQNDLIPININPFAMCKKNANRDVSPIINFNPFAAKKH